MGEQQQQLRLKQPLLYGDLVIQYDPDAHEVTVELHDAKAKPDVMQVHAHDLESLIDTLKIAEEFILK